jgi:hypothetical protein
MRTVVTPWYGLSKFMLLGFGIPFFLVGVVIFFVQDGNGAFLLNGIFWMILGSGLRIKGSSNKRNLEILKREGLCYDGSVVSIIPAHWVRIGSYVTARVECIYKTEKGECLIMSGYHLLSPLDRIDDLSAKIYFDNNNSDKYVIELFRGDNGILFKSILS